jgi:hypothetical protein
MNKIEFVSVGILSNGKGIWNRKEVSILFNTSELLMWSKDGTKEYKS